MISRVSSPLKMRTISFEKESSSFRTYRPAGNTVPSTIWRFLVDCRDERFPVLLLHSIVTLIRMAKPGGFRSVLAESVLIRHQLLILNRGRKRAPNLRSADLSMANS